MDPTGERHGFLARLYRFVEKFGDMESKHLSEYKSELLGGHRVNYFGRWTVEGLSS